MTAAMLLNAIPAVVVLGGAFVIWGKFAKLEQKVDDLPRVMNGSMRKTAQEAAKAEMADHREAYHYPYNN